MTLTNRPSPSEIILFILSLKKQAVLRYKSALVTIWTLFLSRVCMKLSEVFDSMKVSVTFTPRILLHSPSLRLEEKCVFAFGQKHMMSVSENNMGTLGLGLDLESRYQEAEKVWKHMHISFMSSW